MNPLSKVLSSLVGCLTLVALVAREEASVGGVIKVQVTGRLVTVGQQSEGDKEWIVTGYVHAEGRDLMLDCSANASAQKLLKTLAGKHDPWTSTARPIHNVEVKGRLVFRPYHKVDAKGKRVEQTEPIPVLVVEALKVVE